jgi:hypothetical protein
MTIKFHTIFAIGSLLFLLSMQPAAKADTIHVVADVNATLCALSRGCNLPVSFTADFTVTPPTYRGAFAAVDYVESMTGTFNGLPATLVASSGPEEWLYGGNYIPLFSTIYFTSGGLTYSIFYDDLLFGSVGIDTSPFTESSWVNWNGTLVSTPEPSSLLLLLLGTGALLVGLPLIKSKSSSC